MITILLWILTYSLDFDGYHFSLLDEVKGIFYPISKNNNKEIEYITSGIRAPGYNTMAYGLAHIHVCYVLYEILRINCKLLHQLFTLFDMHDLS